MRYKRTISAFLALTMLLCFIGGCGIYNDTPKKASEVFAELKPDSDLMYNSKGSFSVNLTCEHAVFSEDLKSDNLKIYCGSLNGNVLPEIDAAEPVTLTKDEYRVYSVPVASLERTGDKSATVSFTDDKFIKTRPDCYIFVFDKDACKQELIMTGAAGVKYPSFSLVSDTTAVVSGKREFSVNLTLDKGSFIYEVGNKDITLSGGFSECEINSVQTSGDNTLSVSVSCPESFSEDFGYITVSKNAVTDSPFDVTTAIRIAYPEVIFDAAAFEASDNYARISIVLSDCSFLDGVKTGSITCSDENIEINRIDYVSQSEAVIYLSFDMDNVTEAVKAISQANFTIDSAAINLKNDFTFTVKPQSPKVIAVITSVTEKQSDFVVTARLGMLNGTFNTLNKNSFVFGGDYSKAVVESIDSRDNSAIITFVIPRTASAETAALSGTLALKRGAVTGRWGQTEAIPSFPLCYNAYCANMDIDNLTWDINDITEAYKSAASFIEQNSIRTEGELDISCLDTLCYENILLNNSSGTAFMNELLEVVSNEKIPSTAETRYYQNKLLTFISDINTLGSNDYEAVNALAKLIEINRQLKVTNDTQKIENLTADAEKLLVIITNAGGVRFSGKSRNEIINGLISLCNSADGVQAAFDNLVGRQYNWSGQSDKLSELFRYYSYSTILNSMIISLHAMNKQPITPDTESDYYNLISAINNSAEFIEAEASRLNSDAAFCNTIHRTLKLSRFNGGLNQAVLTASGLASLENNLPENVSLKQELSEIAGFDIACARYLICSDSQISDSLTYISVDGDASDINPSKEFLITKKTGLYNLISGVFENEVEYSSYFFKLELDEKAEKPIITVKVKKNTDLFVLT